MSDPKVIVQNKIEEIKKAVEALGVQVVDIKLNTNLDYHNICGSLIPQIADMSLNVTFGLELKVVDKR